MGIDMLELKERLLDKDYVRISEASKATEYSNKFLRELVKRKSVSGKLFLNVTYVSSADLEKYAALSRDYVDVKEASKTNGLSESSIRELIREKKLRCTMFNGKYYVLRQDLENRASKLQENYSIKPVKKRDLPFYEALDVEKGALLKEFEKYKNIRVADAKNIPHIFLVKLVRIEDKLEMSLPYYLIVQNAINEVTLSDLENDLGIESRYLKNVLDFFKLPRLKKSKIAKFVSKTNTYKDKGAENRETKRQILREYDRLSTSLNDQEGIVIAISDTLNVPEKDVKSFLDRYLDLFKV